MSSTTFTIAHPTRAQLRDAKLPSDAFRANFGTNLGATTEWLMLLAARQPGGVDKVCEAIDGATFDFFNTEAVTSLNAVFNLDADGQPSTTMIEGLNLIKLVAGALGPIPLPCVALLSVDAACEFWSATELGHTRDWVGYPLHFMFEQLVERYLAGDLHEDNSPLHCATTIWATWVAWHGNIIPADLHDPSAVTAWVHINKAFSIIVELHAGVFNAIDFPTGDDSFPMGPKSVDLDAFWSKVREHRAAVRKGICFACGTEEAVDKEEAMLRQMTSALAQNSRDQQKSAATLVSPAPTPPHESQQGPAPFIRKSAYCSTARS